MVTDKEIQLFFRFIKEENIYYETIGKFVDTVDSFWVSKNPNFESFKDNTVEFLKYVFNKVHHHETLKVVFSRVYTIGNYSDYTIRHKNKDWLLIHNKWFVFFEENYGTKTYGKASHAKANK